MSIEQFDENLNALSAQMGVPNGSFTFVFAGPPKRSKLGISQGDIDEQTAIGEKSIIPIGGIVNFNIQGSRNAPSQKFLGTQKQVPLPGQGTPETGVIQGLLLLSDYQTTLESAGSALSSIGDTHKWHLLKKMYSYMLLNHPELVQFFYKRTQQNLGLVPVAFDDSDRWRNFARSTLYDLPIGLYFISKSTMGETLEASYLEGVRLQGNQNFAISAVNATPVYEQILFTFVDNIPIDPNVVLSANNDGSMAQYVNLVKEYLGVNV